MIARKKKSVNPFSIETELVFFILEKKSLLLQVFVGLLIYNCGCSDNSFSECKQFRLVGIDPLWSINADAK